MDTIDNITKKAEAGDRNAQYKLAMLMFADGGIDGANKEAMRWLEEAAKQGHKDAIADLEDYYRTEDDSMV